MKTRHILRLLAATLAFILSAARISYGATYENINDLGLSAKSAILMEKTTGNVIYEKNSREKLAPASVTKVMTLLLIYEAQANGRFNWDDEVTVSEHAASMGGSQVFLEPTERQTAADMTKCIAIASANDAAVAMAEFIGGSEEGFVDTMNKRAAELGMDDTHFVNACGLDVEGHVTSARDIAIMSRELIRKFPDIKKYTTTWQDTIIHKTKKGESEFGLTNTNKLLKWYNGATGLKTGSTSTALYCLSATAEKDGMELIGVIMAAPDFKTRFLEAMKLLDYGFANYALEEYEKAGSIVGEVPVYKGETENVSAVLASGASFLTPKGNKDGIEKEVSLTPAVNAPITQGDKLGEVIYKLNGEEIGRAEAIAAQSVKKISLGEMMSRLITKWCM